MIDKMMNETEEKRRKQVVLEYILLLLYRKNSNNRTVCHVIGIAPLVRSGIFFAFFMVPTGAEQQAFCNIFRPYSKVGNSQRHIVL